MKNPHQQIVDFIHEHDVNLSVNQRISLYRAMGETTAVRSVAMHFFLCADELSAANAKCQQLALNFGKEGAR